MYHKLVASVLRKKKDANTESLGDDGIMIKCYNVIVAVKRIFLISGNKFSSYIDSQFSFFTNLLFHVVRT